LQTTHFNTTYNAGGGMFKVIWRLMTSFLVGVSATWADTLWYNGDASTLGPYGNAVAEPIGGDVWVYGKFIVPAGDGAWQITAVFSNNVFPSNSVPNRVRWEIRTNMSPSSAGTLIAGDLYPAVVNATGRVLSGEIEYSVLAAAQVTLFPGEYWLSVAPVDPGVPQSFPYAFISSTTGANCVGNPCGNDGNSFAYEEPLVPTSSFLPIPLGSLPFGSRDFSMGILGSKSLNAPGAPAVGVIYPASWTVSPPVGLLGWATDDPTNSHYSRIASVRVFRDGSFVGNATYGQHDFCKDHYSPACPADGFSFSDNDTSGGIHTFRVVATDSDAKPDSGYLDVTYVYAGTGSNTNAHPGLIWQNPLGASLYVQAGASQIWFLGGAQGTTVIGGAELDPNPNPWRIAGMADFDGDGHPDVVWQDPLSGAAQVWFLTGARGATFNYVGAGGFGLSGPNAWRIAAVADIDGDGHPDLVWQDPETGASQVWFMSGALGGTIDGAAMLSGPNTWRIFGAADFDGNGHADLVWQDPATGVSQVWFMAGAQGTVMAGATPLSGPNAWRIGRVMDFDGDGHPDLVWQDPVTGTSQAWLFGGAQGTTMTAAVALTGPTPLLLGR
jgi:hypothetical protein